MALFNMKILLKNFCFLFILVLTFFLINSVSSTRLEPIQKRNSFASIGCLGLFDNSKFNRLDKICEECYSVTRAPGFEDSCRRNCFRNDVFVKCIDLLLYTNQKNELSVIADTLYGS